MELELFFLCLSFKHVMYLRELRLAQMERIMAEFIYGVDIYLSVVRDAKEINPKVKHTTEPLIHNNTSPEFWPSPCACAGSYHSVLLGSHGQLSRPGWASSASHSDTLMLKLRGRIMEVIISWTYALENKN